MKKQTITLAALLIVNCQLIIDNCFAQSFQPTVIGSAGTFTTSASGSMAWTIAEVMTETYSSTGNFFTQGFHQPDSALVISVNEIAYEHISIYPNPISDNLHIDFSSSSGNYSVEIFDMQGQLLGKKNIPANEKQVRISFREFANGVYLLNIINAESNTRNSHKINKIK